MKAINNVSLLLLIANRKDSWDMNRSMIIHNSTRLFGSYVFNDTNEKSLTYFLNNKRSTSF